MNHFLSNFEKILLFIDKNKIIKADEIFFLEKIDEYEKILQELSTDSVA